MKKIVKILLIFLAIPFVLNARTYDYEDLTNRVKERFASSLELYKDGKAEEAREVAQSAYFELFENLEGPIRINVSSKKSWTMERKFTKIRNLIKDGANVEEIKATIDSLNADMDEVLPKLKDGTVIVAETTQSDTVNEETLDVKWQTLHNNIADKLQASIEAFKSGDRTKTKELIRAAQFEDYRNSMMEVAIRKYVSQAKDGQIQNNIRRVIIAVDSMTNETELRTELVKIEDDILNVLNELPKEAAELAVVDVEADTVGEQGQDFKVVLEDVKKEGAKTLELYKGGDSKKAISTIQNAYFDIFEASGMEVRVGAVDNGLKTTIEGTFSEITALIKSGADIDKVEWALEKLYSEVESGVVKLSDSGTPWSLFIYALIIILREGVEALIVVAAVIAYLIKSGNGDRIGIVHSSLWTAIILSFATAFVMNYLFNASGESREMLEGVTMLIAVLLLFYVGFWLLSNAHAKKWARYISGKVRDSLSSGSAKALWFTVFLAVYREGAETVLFYQAILFDAKNALGYSAVAVGLVIGLALLTILFFLLKAGAVKIPIKPFFIITSAIIFYMSVVFTGKGIMELVEGKIIEPTIIEGFPTITWLGIYPYVQSLLPQIALILGIIIGTILIRSRAKKTKDDCENGDKTENKKVRANAK